MTAGWMHSWVQLLLVYGCTLLLCAEGQLTPQIDESFPPYGPVAGKTRIFLRGSNLSHVQEVWLQFDVDDIQLAINYTGSTDEIIDCLTPAAPTVDFLSETGTYLLIFNQSDGLFNYTATQTFTYKPDPVVTGVTPLKSIIRGGVEQTIVGQNLDSVHEIYARLTMTILHQEKDIYKQADYKDERLEGLCRIHNSTLMYCNSKPISNSPIHPIPGWNPLNRQEYQIWLGYELDGVMRWNYTPIEIWQDPIFNGFDIMAFKVYKGQKEIELWGNYLNLGVKKKDYNILIGNGTARDGTPARCEITYIITNLIRCEPPQDRPYVGDIHKDGEPRITVDVGYLYDHLGYLRYELKPWDDPNVRTIVISVVCVAAALIIIIPIVVVCTRKKRRDDQRPLTSHNGYSRPPGLWDRVPPDLKQKLNPTLKDQDKLRLGRALGEGNFGSVHAGKFQEEDGTLVLVAAKTIKDSGVTPQQLREFLEEATMMRDFDHPHVLHLVGVVFKAGRPYVLLPFMENGDLRTHILNENNRFTVEDLIQYALQIAWGMGYIAGQNFVHRDLAARNCMINKENVVKIADFGLARDVYGDDYYRVSDNARPLPIKWMALECLDDRVFTKYSDIWSYGVTVWELLTRGKRPYSDVDNFSLRTYLSSGRRLESPAAAPDAIYQLMLRCWAADPKLRPEFEQIALELDELLRSDDNAEMENIPSDPEEGGPETRRYQNLSRYVDYNSDRHKYESIIVEAASPLPTADSGYTDMSGSSKVKAKGINYNEAQAAFDSIPEADDYIRPDGDADANQPNGYLSPQSLTGGTAVGHSNPGYDNMDAILKHEESKREQTPVGTEDIALSEMS